MKKILILLILFLLSSCVSLGSLIERNRVNREALNGLSKSVEIQRQLANELDYYITQDSLNWIARDSLQSIIDSLKENKCQGMLKEQEKQGSLLAKRENRLINLLVFRSELTPFQIRLKEFLQHK